MWLTAQVRVGAVRPPSFVVRPMQTLTRSGETNLEAGLVAIRSGQVGYLFSLEVDEFK